MPDVVDFTALTEVSGDEVTAEQIDRLSRRYTWAAAHCGGRDVLEVGCGTGQGCGLLAAAARSFVAGDYSEQMLLSAHRHYGERINFQRIDAEQLPYRAASFDVVVIFEASYYIPNIERFFAECRRVLRPTGVLLLATANKDLFDFNPSPHSYRYLGVVELERELAAYGFSVVCFGDTPVDATSIRQRVLRPAKAAAARLGLIPKSMNGKKLLKRLVFGGLVPMPAEIAAGGTHDASPVRLSPGQPDRAHKVLFCAATRSR